METCQLCGAVRDPAEPTALAWACERDRDGWARWLCPECARRHVRDIEAKLPREWW
ncbi:hypothetical protein [Pseudonocardia nigra]|uniref:hypothetical protein n=1 Tax=Pseudonocardia nigra TaxID=1921578 RepID=UPI001C5FD0F3|nr:hypothetical protein [Pseudonocardia nigra]